MLNPNTRNIAKLIIRIPVEFMRQSKSMHWLLKETTYFENYRAIGVDVIVEVLKEEPNYIENWLQYSDDQRCIPAFYFKQNGIDDYIVDRYPSIPDYPKIHTSDKFEACAVFIKRYCEQIRVL